MYSISSHAVVITMELPQSVSNEYRLPGCKVVALASITHGQRTDTSRFHYPPDVRPPQRCAPQCAVKVPWPCPPLRAWPHCHLPASAGLFGSGWGRGRSGGRGGTGRGGKGGNCTGVAILILALWIFGEFRVKGYKAGHDVLLEIF